MSNDWNNVKPVGCKPWLVLPAVYSDALSYGDQIAQFCAALNKVIDNNNNLPSYVSQMIQDYISGGVIGEIVQSVIAQFILNVKYPPEGITPAIGDGSADDTAAVQGCIDYAATHNGMAVYFPSGAYSVQSLTLKSEVSLFGFDRYSTKLVLRGGATTPMVLLNGSDCGIYNLTLDGNAGVQVENINAISMIAQDVLLDNLIIQNGYQLLVYNGTGGHLQINDVVFGNAVYRAVGISGNSIVQAKGLKFNQLSSVSGVDIINIASDGGTYDFISDVPCETCLSISGNDNYVTGIERGATNAFIDSGMRNTIDFKGNKRKEYYYDSSDVTIEGDVGFSTNGAYSENISGNYTSVKNSSESIIVTGNSTTQYNADKTENVAGRKTETIKDKYENIIGLKNVNSENSVEIVANKKTINAEDIVLNPTNPLTYKTPTATDIGIFDYVPAKDGASEYQILVKNEKTTDYFNMIDSLESQKPVNVLTLGFDNTGASGISDLFNTYTQQFPLYFPSGTYLVDKPITLGYPIYGVDRANGIEWDIEDATNYSKFVCGFEGGYIFTINENSKTASIKNIVIVMDNHNTNGVNFSPNSFRSIILEGVSVFGLKDATAFYFNPGVVTSKGVWMTNCSVFGEINAKSIGVIFEVNCPDCNINNCMFMAVQKGILCYANILYASNIHIWNGMYYPNPGATLEYWKDTQGIYLNNALFFGTNIYIDTSRVLIATEDNTNNRAFISNLIVWYDESTVSTGLTDASLFLDNTQTSLLEINGGYIYSGNALQYAITDSVKASNLKVATDKDFDNNYHYLFPTYPRVNINNYELLGLYETSENYKEIARLWYQYGGTAILMICDGEGNTAQLFIFKGSTTTIYKKTLNGSLSLYYKVINNIMVIFSKNPTNDYQVFYLACDDELGGLIYPLVDKLDRRNGFTRLSQNDSTGLTEITEQS